MVTALTVGELVVAGVAVAGAAGTAYAAHTAADATKDATNAAIGYQKQALTSQQQLNQPYNTAGTGALTNLQKLLGLNPDGSQMTPAQQTANSQTQEQTLASTPGYQFAKSQGLSATTNAAAAAGLSTSGNTLEALDKYSTGLADSTYQESVGNLQSLVNTGQAAAAGQAANVGSSANNISNLTTAQGNTNAGIVANETAGISKIAGSAANNFQTNQTLQDIYGTQGLNSNGTLTPTFDASLGSALGQTGTPINTSLVTGN